MKYQSQTEFTHQQTDRVGVLLTNLGTPQAPTKKALKPYLKQFLSDPRVVEVPKLIWWFILNGIILNIRPRRSAKAYATVWSEEGSPLLVNTKLQTQGVAEKLKAKFGDDIIVEFAMRYGQPAVDETITSMLNRGVRKLLVLPLYPQYCASTTGSTFDAVAEDFRQRRWLPELRFINQYHDMPSYIDCLADKIKTHRDAHGQADMLIFSYHGIPKRYLLNGDPYHCQCHKTSRLVAEKLGLDKTQFMTTFQSRFGREEWLKPYTDETLKELPNKNIKTVQVVCPGFSSDCLETIEEIGEENREYFMHAGGEDYQYIPALNADTAHIDMLHNLVVSNVQDWLKHSVDESSYIERKNRALEMGASQ